MTDVVKVVKIYPTKVWYERDFAGTVHIKMQRQDCHEHTIVKIQYDYAYCSNATQHKLAKEIGRLLGEEAIQERIGRLSDE